MLVEDPFVNTFEDARSTSTSNWFMQTSLSALVSYKYKSRYLWLFWFSNFTEAIKGDPVKTRLLKCEVASLVHSVMQGDLGLFGISASISKSSSVDSSPAARWVASLRSSLVRCCFLDPRDFLLTLSILGGFFSFEPLAKNGRMVYNFCINWNISNREYSYN